MTLQKEDHELMAGGIVDIKNPATLDAMNSSVADVTASPSLTAYIAWERVAKVLATYHIPLPKVFLEGSHGNQVIPVSQFGKKFGMTDQGEVKVNDESGMFLYFEWQMTDMGDYDVFAEVVSEDDLREILDDYDSEEELAEEKSELAKGIEDESGEHGMSKKEAQKTAKDHLKKDSKYYSKLEKIGLEEKKDPCWDGYEMVGMKKKGKKKVPNCVPVAEATLGGQKYKRKSNPNNKNSKKSQQTIKDKMQDAYGKVADAQGHARKRLLQTGLAAFKVGMAQKEVNEMAKNDKDTPPFDNPTEKPSTPYKNPNAKAKQLARAAMKKMKAKKLEEEQLDELKGYQSAKGQKLLQKVQKRAVSRSIKAADAGDAKNAKKNQEVANNAWDRFDVKEEQLAELRRLSDGQKSKLQKRIRAKHDKAWNKTQEIRTEKKSKGSEDTKSIDAFRNRLAKIHNKLDEGQINEVSKEKLLKYIPRAAHDAAEYGRRAGADDVEDRKVQKKRHSLKAKNRVQGIIRASRKLAKEETQIQEVSAKYLDKKMDKGMQLLGKYAGQQKWKRAEKKVSQVEKIQKYMAKKGMKSELEDENQKRYDSLEYKGD